jgi:ubiquinone/menaquinone biosynthesis C-methylase UbiE
MTEEEHEAINEASRRAGLFDADIFLNQKTGEVINKILKLIPGQVFLLDVGAGCGDTSVEIIKALDEENKGRVFFTLLDPVGDLLEAASQRLSKLGLTPKKDYSTVRGRDLDIPKCVAQESQHVVTAVAVVHHHSSIDKPLNNMYNALVRGGFLVVGDWHHTMWEHPNRVYKLLKQMEWPAKEQGLKSFVKAYPNAEEEISDPPDLKDRRANEQISRFWIEYSKLEHRTKRFGMLEGHRPASAYLEDMVKVGFATNTDNIKSTVPENPDHILPDSSLLCVTIGEK